LTSAPHPKSISLANYPVEPFRAAGDPAPFALLQNVIDHAPEQRADRKLDPKTTFQAALRIKGYEFSPADLSIVSTLARLTIEQHRSDDLTAAFDLQFKLGDASQNGALTEEARGRILKDMARQQRALENTDRQLNDPTFVSRAPEKIVASLRAKRAEYEAQLAKNKKLLEGLE